MFAAGFALIVAAVVTLCGGVPLTERGAAAWRWLDRAVLGAPALGLTLMMAGA